MNYTSINIKNSEHTFKYIIEYFDDEYFIDNIYSYDKRNKSIYFSDNTIIQKRDNNVWYNEEFVGKSNYIPSKVDISSINLYFPEYSIDIYDRGLKYALTINTWINNHEVYLGTYIIDRNNAEASDKIRTFYDQKYYEKINLKFIDPWNIIYSDDWESWRYNLTDSLIYNDTEINNGGSILNFTLHVVEEQDGIYIKSEKYEGGQNSIRLRDQVNENIKYHIEPYEGIPEFGFLGNITFNKSYSQDYEGLMEYIKSTYNIQDPLLRFDFYFQDKEHIYNYISTYSESTKNILYKKNINKPGDGNIYFKSWDEYVDGLQLISSLNIVDSNNPDDEDSLYMTIMSNQIPITPELYKFLIYDGDNMLNYVKLNLIDMNVYNINTVNKIQKNIIQIDRPKDYKSNIIKPVYYRTRDLSNIVIHPQVTENICINLDAYRSNVESFIIKIGGVNFLETGRTSNGTLFKIIGNRLPQDIKDGIYYILNQDSELITSGKFTCEI